MRNKRFFLAMLLVVLSGVLFGAGIGLAARAYAIHSGSQAPVINEAAALAKIGPGAKVTKGFYFKSGKTWIYMAEITPR